MRVALIIGHRKSSQGAYGNKGISEWKFNKKLVKELLENQVIKNSNNEFKVFYRRDDLSGYTERMKDLHKRIDKWGAKLSVSFHFNASANKRASGHEVLYYSSGGRKYAKKMNDLFTQYLDNKDRGLKHISKGQRGGGFLSRGRSKCILVEPFFAVDQDLYVSGEGRENLINSFIDLLA